MPPDVIIHDKRTNVVNVQEVHIVNITEKGLHVSSASEDLFVHIIN